MNSADKTADESIVVQTMVSVGVLGGMRWEGVTAIEVPSAPGPNYHNC